MKIAKKIFMLSIALLMSLSYAEPVFAITPNAFYVIQYKDRATGRTLCDSLTRVNLKEGKVFTECYMPVPYYDPETSSLACKAEKNGAYYTFYYNPSCNSNGFNGTVGDTHSACYIVNYIDRGTGGHIMTGIMKAELDQNKSYTEFAPEIAGYCPESVKMECKPSTVSVPVYKFYYTPSIECEIPVSPVAPTPTSALDGYSFYVVRYISAANSADLAPSKASAKTKVGASVTEEAIKIPGYKPDKNSIKLTVATDINQNVITFKYSEDINEYVTAYYKDKNSNTDLAAPQKLEQKGGGKVTAHAKAISGYTPDSNEKSSVATKEGGIITFYYTSDGATTVTASLKDGSYTIYCKEQGTERELAKPKAVLDVVPGSYLIDAPVINGYSPDALTKEASATTEGGSVTFYYTEDASKSGSSPDTSDSTNIVIFGLAICASAFAIAFLLKRAAHINN